MIDFLLWLLYNFFFYCVGFHAYKYWGRLSIGEQLHKTIIVVLFNWQESGILKGTTNKQKHTILASLFIRRNCIADGSSSNLQSKSHTILNMANIHELWAWLCLFLGSMHDYTPLSEHEHEYGVLKRERSCYEHIERVHSFMVFIVVAGVVVIVVVVVPLGQQYYVVFVVVIIIVFLERIIKSRDLRLIENENVRILYCVAMAEMWRDASARARCGERMCHGKMLFFFLCRLVVDNIFVFACNFVRAWVRKTITAQCAHTHKMRTKRNNIHVLNCCMLG